MKIHEYQAKQFLKRYGVPVPEGAVADTAAAARAAARALGGAAWVVKAQVQAGARGKAGGIKPAHSLDEVEAAAAELLGRRLVTSQTGPEGGLVKRVYVEQACEAERECYLAVLVDRSIGKVALMASAEGGVDIEEVAARSPDRILKATVDPADGLPRDEAARIAAGLGLDGALREAAVELMTGICTAFLETDASLIEINPLVATRDGALRVLDVKMSFDDNALFRHPEIEALRDADEVDPSELEAKRFELNYVKLEGDIGVMVNGAGMALATIDILELHGGEPADFMDVRPVAGREQIATGFGMLLGNPKVKAILVNVYGGGILRCDTVAEGVAAACRGGGLGVPLVVRAAGTNMEMFQKILTGQGIPATFAKGMAEAAAEVVADAKREPA
jgi:succinyl-CoA synthetase beta subunit